MTEFHNGTPDPQNDRRVGDLFSPSEIVVAFNLPVYDPKHEARPPRRRGARGKYKHAAEVDALLAPYVEDAIGGVPDRLLAQRTGLSAQQVKQWRSRRRIRGRRGRAPVELGTRFMVAALLGEETNPVPHEFSVVEGTWRPPAYALRKPLNYELFTSIVGRLRDEFTAEEIADGIGIEARDVAMATVIGAAGGGR